jgi:hypothetical protein
VKVGGGASVSTELKALDSFRLFVTRQKESENIPIVTATLCGQSIPDTCQRVQELENRFLLKLDLEAAWMELALPDQRVVVEVAVCERLSLELLTIV